MQISRLLHRWTRIPSICYPLWQNNRLGRYGGEVNHIWNRIWIFDSVNCVFLFLLFFAFEILAVKSKGMNMMMTVLVFAADRLFLRCLENMISRLGHFNSGACWLILQKNKKKLQLLLIWILFSDLLCSKQYFHLLHSQTVIEFHAQIKDGTHQLKKTPKNFNCICVWKVKHWREKREISFFYLIPRRSADACSSSLFWCDIPPINLNTWQALQLPCHIALAGHWLKKNNNKKHKLLLIRHLLGDIVRSSVASVVTAPALCLSLESIRFQPRLICESCVRREPKTKKTPKASSWRRRLILRSVVVTEFTPRQMRVR